MAEFVTVSKKRKRVYSRKFDHDEARRLWAEELLSFGEIAKRMDVSYQAVRRICIPAVRKQMDEQSARWAMSGECGGCGGRRNRVAREMSTSDGYVSSGLCRTCWAESRQTRFRFDELGNLAAIRCATCKTWKDADLFPRDRASAREKHEQCRECGTKSRQDYRERHKVPCEDCGSLCLPQREKQTTGVGFPRCRPCYKLWRHTPEGKASARAAGKKSVATRKARGDYQASARPKPQPRNRCPRGHQREPGRKTCDECRASEEALG